jgi:hypothetical protein
MLDRHEFAELVGRGFAAVPHAGYAPAWWYFQPALDRGLRDHLIIYDLNLDMAIRTLVEDGWVYTATGEPFVGPGRAGHYRHRWVDVNIYEENAEGEQVVVGTERELMMLHINWVSAAADRPARDAIELQLMGGRAEYVGMLITQDRTAGWGGYLQGAHQIYHMFDVGIGFPPLWQPWWLNDIASGPATNWANMDWPETYEISQRLRASEVITEQGIYEFVGHFMDLMINLNYELDRIPMLMITIHDFFPNWLGNLNSTGFWDIGMTAVRIYDTRR